ncbi:ester cyclase [Microbispora sp. RL4-1S]|uniref:Ester cyclase n=1 Tax=Microbispora oryzae TaxID=2806554 RepID=A0A940WJQ9_9ACTN|nr:ester cyclase [Microbispora oryzae]MBP2704542.1 ester cyclase [Microbispora oryzae]
MSDLLLALDNLRKAYNHHDLDALARCFAPGAILVAPDGIGDGREETASYYAQFIEAFPDTRVTVQTLVETGDILVSEYTISGTHMGPYLIPGGGLLQPSGRRIIVRACCLSQVQDGLISSHRIYYDQAELAAQLGGSLCFDEDLDGDPDGDPAENRV